MSDLSGGVWVRALGLEERLVAAYNTAGNMTIAHALWLSSNTPLTHSILSNALWALYSHVITDGVSNMRISHHLLQFLKKEVQIAAGREKEESRDSEKDAVEELGVFTSPVAEEQAMERKERDAEFASIACSGPLPGPALYMTLYPPHTTGTGSQK
nr:uncharacterized protein LOC128698847 [Cherax quadricarinatus]